MRRTLLVIVTGLVLCSLPGCSDNDDEPLGPEETRIKRLISLGYQLIGDDDLRSVCFVDSLYGWTAGNDGDMFRTVNGGVDWSPINSGTNRNIYAIHMVDTANGWYCGAIGVVARTADGDSWVPLSVPTNKTLTDIYFRDLYTGWAVGANAIFRTLDGGIDWEEPDDSISEIPILYQVQFVSAKVGWTVGLNGSILESENGGRTWNATTSNTLVPLFNICMVDRYTGWAVGVGGTIVHTDDGVEWTGQTTGVGDVLRGVDFVDNLRGVAVGDNGVILTTFDGGQTWTRLPIGISQGLRSVTFTSPETAVAVGDEGIVVRLAVIEEIVEN